VSFIHELYTLLQGIRAIKSYNWEAPFAAQLDDIRAQVFILFSYIITVLLYYCLFFVISCYSCLLWLHIYDYYDYRAQVFILLILSTVLLSFYLNLLLLLSFYLNLLLYSCLLLLHKGIGLLEKGRQYQSRVGVHPIHSTLIGSRSKFESVRIAGEWIKPHQGLH
jgi:hypothetical protein